MTQFTASEVRAAIAGFSGYSATHHGIGNNLIAMLHAYADLLEAQEKAVPVEAIGCLSIRRFRGCDSMVNHDFDYFGSLADGDYRLYTHPQPPAQDAKDAARYRWLAQYPNLYTVNDLLRADQYTTLTRACNALMPNAAMAKESGR